MGDPIHTADDARDVPIAHGRERRWRGDAAVAERPPPLQLVIVEYDDGPDRATLHPPGLVGVERMETWLSADAADFVSLSANR